jgi:ABC-type branched-subunit amino acid transport system permease subunit
MRDRWTDFTLRAPGSRFAGHALLAFVIWLLLSRLNTVIDAQLSYYLALAAMYATAMFGMTILVGLSGQVSLGNGALMAVGGYVFALTSMNWKTVPILGLPWNAVWSMIFAGVGGVIIGLVIGALGARLRGPYLAGLTLGIAVGIPSIINRYPSILGGEQGLKLIVPYPEGGYTDQALSSDAQFDDSALDEFLVDESVTTEAPMEEAAPAEGDLLTLEDAQQGVAQEDLLTLEDAQQGVAQEDLLTLEDAQQGVAQEDLLTLEDAQQGVAQEDLLTLEDAQQGVQGMQTDVATPEATPEIAADPADAFTAASDFVLQQWQASVAIAVACIVGFVALNLVRGRQGRVWQAVRDDPVAAAVVGISPSGGKVSAFVVSSLFAALSGAVFAQILTLAAPSAFGLGLSLSLLVGVVLGGRLSLVGAVIGALLIVWLPEWVDSLSSELGLPRQVADNAPNLLYGLLVVAVVLLAPRGIMGGVSDLLGRLRKSPSSSS